MESEQSVTVYFPIQLDMRMILMQVVREMTVSSEGGTAGCKRCWVLRVEDNFCCLFAVHHAIYIWNSIIEHL